MSDIRQNFADTQCEYCGAWDDSTRMLRDNAIGELFCSQECYTVCMHERAESDALTAAYYALVARVTAALQARGWRCEWDSDGDESSYFIVDETGMCLPPFDYPEVCEDEARAWRVAVEWALDMGVVE